MNTYTTKANARGYYSRVQSTPGTSEGVERKKKSGSSLMMLCKDIAGTLIRRYSETGDPRKACDEVRSVLVEKLDCSAGRAIALIDLALEMIRLNSYGEYRRSDLEMSLLVSRAAGTLREIDLN